MADKFSCTQVEADVLLVRLSLVALLPMSFLIGVFAARDQPRFAFVLVGLSVLPFWTFVRAAKVEFGRQGMLWKQTLVEALTAGPTSLAIHVPWALMYHVTPFEEQRNVIAAVNVVVTVHVALFFGTRGLVGGMCCCFLRGCSPFLFGWRDTPAHSPWLGFTVGVVALFAASARYRVEQHTLALLGVGIGSALSAGGHIDILPEYSVSFFAIACLLVWLEILWMRRRRQLPPDLRGCKFVRLAYLRELAKHGRGIQRCQDLPAEAFGDPSKARVLIAVSHRWMDRYSCDVRTDSHPEGLRLRTMLDQLEQFFSTAGIGAGKGLCEKLKRFGWSLTSGSDVLLFFDFMSLPQVGLKDGIVSERTAEETRTFRTCLPAMGVLYSMFPVMVCQEVEAGMTPYLESGWCFSECCTAWLGGQLDDFSRASSATQWFSSKAASIDGLESVARALEDCLWEKTFLEESDRDIVRNIIRGYTVKRRLIESISSKSLLGLEEVLAELREGDRLSILDQPVDSNLNTPLHLAVKLGFPDGVRRLLDFGADKTLRNLVGDTPVQCYIWPRIGVAARACRQHAQGRRTLKEVAWMWWSETLRCCDSKWPSHEQNAMTDSLDDPCSLKEAVGVQLTTEMTQSGDLGLDSEAESLPQSRPSRQVISLDDDDMAELETIN